MNEPVSNEVVVTFTGICTHCESVPLTRPAGAVDVPDPEPVPGRYRRTVLVEARSGRRLGGRCMPPHDAQLRIRREFIDIDLKEKLPVIPGLTLIEEWPTAIWKMEGVRLYVAHARPGLTITESFFHVPSLTESVVAPPLHLDERVVLEGRAAAVFDIFAGELDAYRMKEETAAVRGKLTVWTAEQPHLVIAQIWSQTFVKLPLKPAYIHGHPCAPNVSLTNVGDDDADKELDFLMHYDVTTWSPPVDTPQPHPDVERVRCITPEEHRCLEQPYDGLSIGCSNTIYP